MFGLFSSAAALKERALEIAEFSLYIRHSLNGNGLIAPFSKVPEQNYMFDFVGALGSRDVVLDDYNLKLANQGKEFNFHKFDILWQYMFLGQEPNIVGTGFKDLYGLNIHIVPHDKSGTARRIMVSVKAPIRVQLGEARMGKNADKMYHALLNIPEFYDVEQQLRSYFQ